VSSRHLSPPLTLVSSSSQVDLNKYTLDTYNRIVTYKVRVMDRQRERE